jgi:hypothetical protein
MGEKSIKGLSSSPFFALNAKGGENIKLKAKGPHHHFKKLQNEFLNLCRISNWYIFQNPLENLRGEFHSRGAFMLSK